MENFIQAVPVMILVAALLAAIFWVPRHWPNDLGRLSGALDRAMPGVRIQIGRIRRQFRHEIGRLFPLWSAATTENREAEFVNDRLPDRFPFWLVVLVIVAVGVFIWWIG